MPELLLVVGLLLIASYAFVVHRVVRVRRPESPSAAVTRMPHVEGDYLTAARDHYRRLARWARLLEDLRRDELVWPLLPQSTKTLVDHELDEFYRL